MKNRHRKALALAKVVSEARPRKIPDLLDQDHAMKPA